MRELPRVIITADDYGLHPDINAGILQCLDQGLINAVSVAACGEAVNGESLAELTRRGDRLCSVGIHLMLSEGRPLTSGRGLRGGSDEFPRYVTGVIARLPALLKALSQVEAEWGAQIRRLLDLGLRPNHMDGHQHVHLLPGLWGVARKLARDHGVARIRTSYQSLTGGLATLSPRLFLFQTLAALRYASLPERRRTVGVLCSCGFSLDRVRPSLDKAILRGESVEIMVHPGIETEALRTRFGCWHASWGEEIRELRRLREYLESRIPGQQALSRP